ncbi:unnamed protein product [Penicillium nalgiovense]|nr:unnamed protein product [Penicillium nalgiovense]
MAIVEVKSSVRDINPNSEPIRTQEGAQMAAWICQHPPPPSQLTPGRTFTRLLVSQDRENIYLTFAKFNSSYVHYICDDILSPKLSAPLGKQPSTESKFLTMYEYGPFDTGKDNHMDSLGQILLAFSIREWDIREASRKPQTKR